MYGWLLFVLFATSVAAHMYNNLDVFNFYTGRELMHMCTSYTNRRAWQNTPSGRESGHSGSCTHDGLRIHDSISKQLHCAFLFLDESFERGLCIQVTRCIRMLSFFNKLI